MNAGNEQRQLAAIMFTDMVGYSALAQRDDKLALELLEEHRQLLRDIFPRFNGTEIKTIGDAFLIEFHSALEAAQCAIEIQRTLAKRNHDVPAERRIDVKIGIHIGDVVHRGGDVYGDGVNIASRIEQVAGAGGICVSMDVERQIRNSFEARFEKLAPTELKNISVAMDLFRIVLPWEQRLKVQPAEASVHGRSVPASRLVWIGAIVLAVLGAGWWFARQSGKQAASSPSVSTSRDTAAPRQSEAAAKSIAVLPFLNMSADKNDEYLSDGVSEELITALSKITGLQVKARTSSFAFKGKNEDIQKIGELLHVSHLLEGSVAKAGNKLRITAQLIQASDGNHLWSDTYDREMQDIFAVRSEVAQQVAEALKIRLLGEDKKKLDKKPTENLKAFQYYMQGQAAVQRRTSADLLAAISYYEKALEQDHNYALAYAGLADAYANLGYYGAIAPIEGRRKAEQAARQALALDQNLAEAHAALGAVHAYYSPSNFSLGDKELRHAMELSPSLAVAPYNLGISLVRQGRLDEALAELLKARELDPLSSLIARAVAIPYYFKRDYTRAFEALRQANELGPALSATWEIGLYIRNGSLNEAFAEIEKAKGVRKNDPLFVYSTGMAYAASGKQADALQSIKELEAMSGASLSTAHWIAKIYATLNNKEMAFSWLERGLATGALGVFYKDEPVWDPIRDDPRFAALMRKIGFTEP